MLPDIFNCFPSVFTVGDRYIIAISASVEATAWVRIGEKNYYDESNGILRSKKYIHLIEIPQRVLDDCCEYTAYLREYIDRAPYFPKSLEPKSINIAFRPLTMDQDKVSVLHIADTHGNFEMPVRSACDNADILVLNGDIADHSGCEKNFNHLYMLAGAITHGEIPCLFARGNHDLRGQFAEIICDYTPTDCGKSYYTFKLGPLWGLVLDCGEDKADSHEEYGDTVVCHEFRERETEFLKNVVSQREYEKEEVKFRLLVSHVAFAKKYKDPFNPEEEIYTEWSRLLREKIKPDLWLAGHNHRIEIIENGGEGDDFGQPCLTAVASTPVYDKWPIITDFISCLAVLEKDKISLTFRNSKGEIVRRYEAMSVS